MVDFQRIGWTHSYQGITKFDRKHSASLSCVNLSNMSLSVVVPTYRRPEDLVRCLEALKKQSRSADEVLVVARKTDIDTWTKLQQFNPGPLPLKTLGVTVPGSVAALNTALDAVKGEIIVFTDDDAAPHTDWLARIEAHFSADDQIGGVGGRDWIHVNGKPLCGRPCKIVGKLQWFGRTIGNHHQGEGPPREVDILKGVNMSFRRTAIAHLRF